MSGNQERKRPVFYVRVSNLGQDVDETLDHQRDAIAAATTDRGLDLHQEYVDQEPSGDDTHTQEA